MTRVHNPPHPGETLREDVFPALRLTEHCRAWNGSGKGGGAFAPAAVSRGQTNGNPNAKKQKGQFARTGLSA